MTQSLHQNLSNPMFLIRSPPFTRSISSPFHGLIIANKRQGSNRRKSTIRRKLQQTRSKGGRLGGSQRASFPVRISEISSRKGEEFREREGGIVPEGKRAFRFFRSPSERGKEGNERNWRRKRRKETGKGGRVARLWRLAVLLWSGGPAV